MYIFLSDVDKYIRDEFDLRRVKASPFAKSRIYAIRCMTRKVVRVLEGRCLFVI